MTNIILISILVSLNLLFLVIGIILGKTFIGSFGSYEAQNKNESINSFFTKQKNHDHQQKSTNIDIDERKVVVAIKTDGLEKKYDSLGDVKQSSDSISSSIDKLKNMKGL